MRSNTTPPKKSHADICHGTKLSNIKSTEGWHRDLCEADVALTAEAWLPQSPTETGAGGGEGALLGSNVVS